MSSTPLAETILRRYPRLSRIVGWASLLTLVLGIVASFVGNIADLRRHLADLLGVENFVILHYAMAVIVGLLFFAGYMFGGLWVYRRFFGELSDGPRRLIAASGVIVGLVLAIGTSYLAIPAVPDVRNLLKETSDAWRTELLALGVKGGGLRTSRSDPAAPPQVWSTAQSVVAILARTGTVTSADADQIRSDFEFFERERLPGDEGWGYMHDVDWGATEICAWVALAYAASMERNVGTLIWGTADPQIPRQRLSREIDLLMKRQYSSGGWPPIIKTDTARDTRTYSTVMAVWALLETKNRNVLGNAWNKSYDDAIEKGVRWLLGTYDVDLESWVPNPGRPSQLESFPGLTAQVLFVLGKAKPYFAFIKGDGNYQRAQRAFLTPTGRKGMQSVHDPRSRPVVSNDRTHDSDRYLSSSPHMVESSTYLWLPWSLADCAQNMGQTVPDLNVREATKSMCRIVIGRAKDLIGFAEAEPFVYAMAESLLAINLYVQTDASTSGGTYATTAHVP